MGNHTNASLHQLCQNTATLRENLAISFMHVVGSLNATALSPTWSYGLDVAPTASKLASASGSLFYSDSLHLQLVCLSFTQIFFIFTPMYWASRTVEQHAKGVSRLIPRFPFDSSTGAVIHSIHGERGRGDRSRGGGDLPLPPPE
jgi:hypothetical protein